MSSCMMTKTTSEFNEMHNMKKKEGYCNKLLILALQENFWPKQPKFKIFVISGAFLTKTPKIKDYHHKRSIFDLTIKIQDSRHEWYIFESNTQN